MNWSTGNIPIINPAQAVIARRRNTNLLALDVIVFILFI